MIKKLTPSGHEKRNIEILPPDTPVSPDKVRFVCVSDTHSQIGHVNIPCGDVLIHAGDFTNVGGIKEVLEFNDFMGGLSHAAKIVIAGNHELTFDPTTCKDKMKQRLIHKYGFEDFSKLLTNCKYLQDTTAYEFGYKVYGAPWQPEFMSWAFNIPRGEVIKEKWDRIPTDTDILVTHGPPKGFGDKVTSGVRVGCDDLLNTVQTRVKPMYHIFGHIHEGYGVTTDGTTTFINASTCTCRYEPINPPIIFDLPLPHNITK